MSEQSDGDTDRTWECPECGETERRYPQSKTRPFCDRCNGQFGVLIEMRPKGPGKEKFVEHGGDL